MAASTPRKVTVTCGRWMMLAKSYFRVLITFGLSARDWKRLSHNQTATHLDEVTLIRSCAICLARDTPITGQWLGWTRPSLEQAVCRGWFLESDRTP